MTNEKEPALTNREMGDRWMAAILTSLSDGWPALWNLDPFAVSVETGVLPTEDRGLTSEQHACWMGLIAWLVNEGIITKRGGTLEGDVLGAQITAKGFAALGERSPHDPEKTIGRKMADLAKSNAQAASTEVMKEGGKAAGRELAEVVGSFMGAVAKSFST